jgi:hypothetical protein
MEEVANHGHVLIPGKYVGLRKPKMKASHSRIR